MSVFRRLLQSSISLFAVIECCLSIDISAPAGLPRGASDVVSHAFQSWACAVHSWPDYAGNDSDPNIFSKTMMGIIANRTGSPPHFRVGGTSGDRTTFVANQKEAVKYKTVPGTQIPENVTIGPSFFEAFDTFIDLQTQYTFMVNLASLNLDNALAEARHALDAIGSNLEAIEIGNEPDLYIQQGVRPTNWTEAEYVRQWLSFAGPIKKQVLDNNRYEVDPNFIWQALEFSEAEPAAGFTIKKAFADGVDGNGSVKSVSVHSYMTGYTPETTLQASFMNHTAIVGNVSLWLPWKSYLANHHPNVPLYIGEANSDYVTNTEPITYALQGVFGDALWKVDILMYAMSQSISRYYVQQGTGFAFDSWQPVYINSTAPRVLPPWYGDLFIADVVGKAPDVQIANIDLGSDLLSAYSVYVSGALAKYVIVNLEEWNTTTTYERPQGSVSLSIPAYVSEAKIGKLTAPGADSKTNISWAGQSWEYSETSATCVDEIGVPRFSSKVPESGNIALEIQASEAIVVILNRY